jgi:hypothetical protein
MASLSNETQCSVCKDKIDEIPRVFSCCDKIHCDNCGEAAANNDCPLCGAKEFTSLHGESLEQVFLTGRDPEKWDEIEEVADLTAGLNLRPKNDGWKKDINWPKEISTLGEADGPKIMIFLRPLEGEKAQMTVSVNMTTRDFKKAIAEVMGTDPDLLRFIHKGLPMFDDKTFREGKVTEGSVVSMVMAMWGS